MTHFWMYEWIAIGYFLYLIGTAVIVPGLTPNRRARVAVLSFAVLGVIGGIATVDVSWTRSVRPWLPLVYMVAAYWLPSRLVTRTNEALEARLMAWDRLPLASRVATFRTRAPAAVLEVLELAYLFCYPLVPLGFVALVLSGQTTGADADRFWTTVLGAALPCYGTLPWLATRPPRAIENAATGATSSVRGINAQVLRSVSVGWNTFPSGHAAASIATALAVAARMPVAGAMFGVIAIGICIGSVTGRYHYATDAIAGVALGVAAFAFAEIK
jgi:membrane-associated phospholipid phosphatase